ncbi:hypothetical protein [Streptomyces sp. NPDC051909]|uniref:hypothetical protein n=1 Tax=Streptomyces sp. NPDC051909 TaxID=3154944 RepID=UPI00341B3060
MGADLARLIPSVVPVEGADPELVAIGERYWALAGFMPELGTPVWCEKVRDIPVAGWGRQLYAESWPDGSPARGSVERCHAYAE